MKKREEGQSAVEFALVLPILLLLVCGIIDFGWLFYNQLSVENGCREGARYACVNTATIVENDAQTRTQYDNNVTKKVKENIPAGVRDSANIKVEFVKPQGNCDAKIADGDVKVTITTKMKTLTPVLGTIIGKEKDLTYSVTMKVES